MSDAFAGLTPPLDDPNAPGTPCPECDLPFGDPADELSPPCHYCEALPAAPFAELNPPYSTIVADPPWFYRQGGPTTGFAPLRPPPYSMMTISEIAALDVGALAAEDAHLYLWTTNAYLRRAFSIAEWWGFGHSQTLTWCKPPQGIGPGGAFSNTTEFILYCRRGSLPYEARVDTTWWSWPRRSHSVKPDAFLDIVEQVSPGPYLELFARAPRLGWDSWGKGYEIGVAS